MAAPPCLALRCPSPTHPRRAELRASSRRPPRCCPPSRPPSRFTRWTVSSRSPSLPFLGPLAGSYRSRRAYRPRASACPRSR
eukprot:96409-Alexandrium_andersonii.AAC.1